MDIDDIEKIPSKIREIIEEYNTRIDEDVEANVDDIIAKANELVPYLLQHHMEIEACDLLNELNMLEYIVNMPELDEHNFDRVTKYLVNFKNFAPDIEERYSYLKIAYDIFKKLKRWPQCLAIAVELRSFEAVKEVFNLSESEIEKKQMALMLADLRFNHNEFDDEELDELSSNARLSGYFSSLVKNLDVADPKSPNDIYKSHLSESGSTARSGRQAKVDSARENLADSFVNGFVNAGYGSDTLLVGTQAAPKKGLDWIHQHKQSGKISAAASLGLLYMWNEEALNKLDPLLSSKDPWVQSGALLGVGVAASGLRDECDAPVSVLGEFLDPETPKAPEIRATSLLGLGLAYSGAARADFEEYLCYIGDENLEVSAMACLAAGMIFVGTAEEEIATQIACRLMEANETELDQSLAKYMCLGLSLIFLGKQSLSEGIIEMLSAIEHPLGKFAVNLVKSCAYCGSSQPVIVQELLSILSMEKPQDSMTEEERKEAEESKSDEQKKEEAKQKKYQDEVEGMCVLALAMISVGEKTSEQMTIRMCTHILQCCTGHARRMVPLALAIMYLGHPDFSIVDSISRLSHDHDSETAMASVLALGLVGAGTNNAKIAGNLRNLADYYINDPDILFLVRLSQGLLHAGKGLLAVSPLQSDGSFVSPIVLSSVLPIVLMAFDFKNTMFDKLHYLVMCIAPAFRPRMLMTVDEDLEPVEVDARVGQALDTVGMAGKPRKITGFQTHTTPVLLAVRERGELADDEYVAHTNVLEGIVIVSKQEKKKKSNEMK